MNRIEQKDKIRACQPILRDDIFFTNKTVCVLPLTWWNLWCTYVGYYGGKSEIQPGRINTSEISLNNTFNHSYITKSSWKLLKSWYGADKKLEIFVINNRPDFSLTELTIIIGDSLKKNVKLSLNLKVYEIKDYLCKKFEKDWEWNKLVLKKNNGFSKSLKFLNAKIDITDAYCGELHLVKTNKIQKREIITEEEETKTVENHDSTGYYSPSPELVEPVNEENEIDYEKVRVFKEKIGNAMKGKRDYIRIKRLKTLEKSMDAIRQMLSSLDN